MIDPNELEDAGLTLRTDAGRRPVFFTDAPDLDRVFAILVAMAGEIAVLRARLDTHERLAGAAGVYDRGQVEAYQAAGEDEAQRHADRQAMVERIFHPIADELDALLADERTHATLAGALDATSRTSDEEK